MKIIYIYCKSFSASGVNIITDRVTVIIRQLGYEVIHINNLRNINKKAIIIPYGLITAFEVWLKGYSCKLSLLIDAVSNAKKSEFLFFFKKKSVSLKEKIKMLLEYLVFYIMEEVVIRKYSSIIVVSEYDRKYYQKKFHTNNIRLISNGVEIPAKYEVKQNNKLVLGVLAYWSKGSFRNFKWFMDDYYELLQQKYPNIEIHVAGRGADNDIIHYFNTTKGIVYLGEVKDLSVFFENISISLITLPKDCGILNKVLDSFAYKKIVLGMPHNFHSFTNLKNGYLTYKDIDSLIDSIDLYLNDKKLIDEYTNNAFFYVNEYHNWEKNYNAFFDEFQNTIMK